MLNYQRVIPSANDFQGNYHCPPLPAPLQVTHRPAFRARRQELRPVLGARRLADVKPVAAHRHTVMKSLGKPCFFIFYKSISYMGHLYISMYHIPYLYIILTVCYWVPSGHS